MKLPGFPISSSCAFLLFLFSFSQHVSGDPDESLTTAKVGPLVTSIPKPAGSASNMSSANNAQMSAAGGSAEGSNTTSLEPIMVNVTNDDVFSIPERRPPTPYEAGKSREFIPVRIVPSDSPCIYQKFLYFFNHATQLDVKPVDLLRRAVISSNDTDNYFYDPEDLCIMIDDELNIDMYQYDCTEIGTCTCGLYYGYVDLNVPQPEPINNEIQYNAINGLDRKLVVEEDDRTCVSGFGGHCSLGNSSALEKLYCDSGLECRLDDAYGQILTNQVTQEIYGVCLYKKPDVGFNAADYRRMIDAQ